MTDTGTAPEQSVSRRRFRVPDEMGVIIRKRTPEVSA